MNRFFKIWIFLLVVAIVWLNGCYDGNGLKPPAETSGIQGTIDFTGEWPDSTKQIWVAVLKDYPVGVTDTAAIRLFVIQNLVQYQEIPSNVTSFDYEFELDAGEYGWVLVVWFPDISAWILGAKQLGAYYVDPSDQSQPTAIQVESGVVQPDVNIDADLSLIQNDFPFF